MHHVGGNKRKTREFDLKMVKLAPDIWWGTRGESRRNENNHALTVVLFLPEMPKRAEALFNWLDNRDGAFDAGSL
jgi:hypothetical protein